MATAAQHLQGLGITVGQARDYILANYQANLAGILQLADQYGVTNAMLAEIVGMGFTATDVRAYFAQHNLDSSILEEAEPPEVIPPEDYSYAVPRIVGVGELPDAG